MSDEIDPTWPPPQPKSTSDVHVNWPTTQPAVAPDVDPSWLPPSMPSDQTVLGKAPAPQPTPYPTTRQPPSPVTRRHVPTLALVAVLLAGMACIGVGAVITLLLVEQRSPQQAATPAMSPAPTSVTQPTPSATAAPQPQPVPTAPSQPPQPNASIAGQHVRTESGRVRCWVTANDVGHGGGPVVVCESSGFPQAPIDSFGLHWDLAAIHADGTFHWNQGNIGGGGAPQNDLVLTYGQTYHIQGWTILPSSDGTRFTNDGTDHGMFVSIENVYSF